MTTRHQEVLPVSQARIELSSILNNFRANLHAQPVFVGAHRKAEGVLIPISMWETILEELDDSEGLAIASNRINSGEKSLPIDTLLEKYGLSIPPGR